MTNDLPLEDDRALTLGIRYPSPFFTIGQLYQPQDVKALLKWCQYYVNTDPVISTVVQKMAEYPITEIIWDTDDVKLKQLMDEIFLKKLKIRSTLLNIGLHYFAFGNTFVSVSQGFVRYLRCKFCAELYRLRGATSNPVGQVKYKWEKNNFVIDCKKCNSRDFAEIDDQNVATPDSISIVLWDPRQVDIEWNPVTGQKLFRYNLPRTIRQSIANHRPFMIETLPKIFIESFREKRPIVLDSSNIYHFSRRHPAGDAGGWGRPIIMPVLQELYHMQILRRAEEAIMQQHILPLWVVFPSPQGDVNPIASLNLSNWKQRVEQEIKKWKRDPNYIPVMPIPLGFQLIGGEGKNLDLSPNIRAAYERIISGMDVPIEFVFGGATGPYANANINMRMLENSFINYREGAEELLNGFLIPKICNILKIPTCKAKLGDLKMADDVQQKQLMISLAQGQVVAYSTLLSEFNVDYAKEVEKRKKEIELEQQLRFEEKKRDVILQNKLQDIIRQNQQTDMAQQAQEGGANPEVGIAAGKYPGTVEPDAQAGAQGQPPGGPQGAPGQRGKGKQGEEGEEGQAPPNGAQGAMAGGMPAASGGGEQSQFQITDDDAQIGGGWGSRNKRFPESMQVANGVQQMATQYAQELMRMPPEQANEILSRMKMEAPELYQMVAAQLGGGGGDGGDKKSGKDKKKSDKQVDMRPNPEKLPPRRNNGAV